MSKQNTFTEPPSSLASQKPRRRWPSPWSLILGFLVGVALVAGLAMLGFGLAKIWSSRNPVAAANQNAEGQATGPWQRPIVTDDGLVESSGVRIVQVAVTGDGGLIDLRFQVIDPDKADNIHDLANPPAVVDEASGLVVNQLLMGHSHTEAFKGGVTYYLIFENPGDLVQSGTKVSVLLGNAEVDHVSVK